MAIEMPKTRKFSLDEYHRMAQAGILREDDRVELLEGTIVAMPPIGSRHALSVDRLVRALNLALAADRAWVRSQNPIALPDDSEPQPDIAIVLPPGERYAGRHPGPEDVLLLVEVADTSAAYDRDVKLPLYAAAGIREVWLVDLAAGLVEVYREPSGRRYLSLTTVSRGSPLVPLAFPDLRIEAADILVS